MKPLILEMTAFGSYAATTVVDFRKLTHNLYLITGDTGAGKTTIFDGIMIALYGEASGEGERKSRTFEMLHCDYVEKSVDTKVRLTFAHMGKTHQIERIFHFKKKRDTGEYEKTTPQATFWEEGKDAISKTDSVNKRIEELLGMNAKQFRKIAMLAQGEFKKFLDADSEEKNKILGELFDNSAYVYFQEMFDHARRKLEKRRFEEGFDRIQQAMKDFEKPEKLSAEEAEVYTAGHSKLEQALTELAKTDNVQSESLNSQIKNYKQQEQKLHEELGKASERNKKMDELAQKEADRNDLLKKKPSIKELEMLTERVEQALHKVRPKEVLYQKAEKIYHSTVQEIELLTRQLASLEEERTAKKKAWEQCSQKNEPLLQQLGIAIDHIEKALPRYDELEAKLKEKEDIDGKRMEARQHKLAAQKKTQIAADEIEEIEKRINTLDGMDATAAYLLEELRRAQANLDKLTAQGGISEQIDEIHQQEKELRKEQAALQKLAQKAGELEEAYHTKYQAFISGQAGILAKNLERELEEKGEAVCPVCKTPFHKQISHCFAKTPGDIQEEIRQEIQSEIPQALQQEIQEEIPDQKEIEKAKSDADRKEKERAQQSEKTGKLDTRIQGLKEKALEGLQELAPDCPDWEALDGSNYLDRMIDSYKKQKESVQKKYQNAVEQTEALKNLKQQRSNKKKQLEKNKQDVETCKEQEQNYWQQSEKLAGSIEEMKKTLDLAKYPQKESALKQKNLWETEQERLTNEKNAAETEYRTAETSYGRKSGERKGLQDKLPSFEKDKAEASQYLEKALAESNFKCLEEVHHSLKKVKNFNPSIGIEKNAEEDIAIKKDLEKDAVKNIAVEKDMDTGIENWLKSQTQAIIDYNNTLHNTMDSIHTLKEETHGWEKIDLKQLESKIHTLEQQQYLLQEQLTSCQLRLENHLKTAAAVQEANDILRSTEAAWQRLDSLADLAAGKRNAEGGKLSFDRYVMGYVFREVLEMANQRLDIISGGRYELIHEINARRDNAIAGLEISVLDMATGKSRPSSSLSGGESFFVSLALALGLSDVVQNHAGGTQLDALFIDEGFGTLDSDILDKAMYVLNQLTEGRRLVGIISHVARLEESIPQQIRVKNGREGSSLEIIN